MISASTQSWIVSTSIALFISEHLSSIFCAISPISPSESLSFSSTVILAFATAFSIFSLSNVFSAPLLFIIFTYTLPFILSCSTTIYCGWLLLSQHNIEHLLLYHNQNISQGHRMINNLQKFRLKTEQFAEKVLQMITNT